MSTFKKLFKEYKKLNILQSKEIFDDLKLSFTYYSNKLEGSNLSLIQTRDVIQQFKTKGDISIIDSLMAIDHFKALNQALFFGANKYPLSEKLLLSLHKLLLKNSFEIDPFYISWKNKGQKLGSFKIKSNRILFKQNNVETYYETPSPEESKKIVLESIKNYANSKDDFLVALSKFIQNIYNAHAMFDGNKRLTRLIIAMQLIANDFPLMPIKYNKGEYNIALINGFVKNNHLEILEVLKRNFNQYLLEHIEKAKINKKGSGFNMIL